jgi:uncharacterized membrane protein YraQ (UPF0718 family)
MIQALNANKRMLLAVLITLVVGLNFWIGSRYPNLNEKAYMGGEMQLDALGFDVVIEVSKDDPLYFRIAATTVNWIKTNKTGMIFGIMMAACLMTVMSLFKRRSFVGSFANTAMGAIVGTPLGVCVNCAAPIARGMHSAGARLETTLAMMLSSPTLNVIVLTMLFSLFPWYMALTKIGVTLLFIMVGIPLLSRYLFKEEVMATRDARVLKQAENPFEWSMYEEDAPGEGESWFASILWVGITYLKHLWFIVKTTVPLMLLAGLLGAVAISIMPWNSLSTLMPVGNAALMLGSLFVIAAIGIFLPCPITFDVIAASVLLSAGMPAPYVMALLFTLGIYSVYSFGIVWTAISRNVAVVLTIGLIVMGVVAGYIAGFGERYEKQKLENLALTILQNSPAPPKIEAPKAPRPSSELVAALAAGRMEPERYLLDTPAGVIVDRFPWTENGSGGETSGFTRHDGSKYGIQAKTGFTASRVIIPTNMGRGIASGDVHNDGWADILLAEDRTVGGVTLYANRGGKAFEVQRLDIPELADKVVIVAALVDVNDDGWLDIFVSTHIDGNFIIFNQRGEFLEKNTIQLTNPDNATTFTATFGDIDADGDVDVVVGNWSMGGFRHINATSKNLILVNENKNFKGVLLKELVGETLSTLISDYNNDGIPDLFVGNDFSSPDYFYLGTGKGSLKQIRRDDQIIPHTTTTTMTVHVADVDNDLVPEMYIGEISRGAGVKFIEHMRDADIVCDEVADPAEQSTCLAAIDDYVTVAGSMKRRDVSACLNLSNKEARAECVAINVLWSMVQTQRQSGKFNLDQCRQVIPDHMRMFQYMCAELAKPKVTFPRALFELAIPQIDKHNVLLVKNEFGGFEDKAIERGLELGGWSWNAKFADLDNDGWKDIYISNGFFQSGTRESNIFYLNSQDGNFTDKTIPWGLEDFRVTTSHTYVDIDNDGDLDIITVPVFGNVRVYENNGGGNNAIAIELHDRKTNSYAIGAKVIVRHSNGAKQQLWEVQSGGGFLSFDPLVSHFGLGKDTRADAVEIIWPNGEKDVIKGPFPAGARYVITRGS